MWLSEEQRKKGQAKHLFSGLHEEKHGPKPKGFVSPQPCAEDGNNRSELEPMRGTDIPQRLHLAVDQHREAGASNLSQG